MSAEVPGISSAASEMVWEESGWEQLGAAVQPGRSMALPS